MYEKLNMNDSLNSLGYGLLSDRLGFDNLTAQRNSANMVNLLYETVQVTDEGRTPDSEKRSDSGVILLGAGNCCVMVSPSRGSELGG